MDKPENLDYFELLHDFGRAFRQGQAAEFISQNPGLLTLRSEGVGETIFHHLVIEDEIEAVRCLAAAGAEIDGRDSYGTTPLMHSAQLGYKELVAFLLSLGADIAARDREARGVVHYWTSRCDKDIFPLLIDAGAELNAVDDLGETPLDLVESSLLRLKQDGPPPRISVQGLIEMGFGEETIENFRQLEEKVDFSTLDREVPDYAKARELLLEAGAHHGEFQ